MHLFKKILSVSKEEMIAYDNAFIRIQDAKGEIELAREEGKEEGKQEGEDKKEREMVIKLHLKGKLEQEISDLLDIDIERVVEIIEEYKQNQSE